MSRDNFAESTVLACSLPISTAAASGDRVSRWFSSVSAIMRRREVMSYLEQLAWVICCKFNPELDMGLFFADPIRSNT